MNYYQFDADDAVIANTITSQQLLPLSRYGDSPKYWDDGIRLVHVPYLATDRDIVSANELPDAIGVGVEVVVSSRLANCLKEFRRGQAAELLPVSIVNRKMNVISDEFSLLISRSWINVLDPTESNASLFSDGAIDEIERWVLSKPLLPPEIDWFYAHDYCWIVNELVADAFKKYSITNVRLTRVSVS